MTTQHDRRYFDHVSDPDAGGPAFVAVDKDLYVYGSPGHGVPLESQPSPR